LTINISNKKIQIKWVAAAVARPIREKSILVLISMEDSIKFQSRAI
jgi:hypothetical protein